MPSIGKRIRTIRKSRRMKSQELATSIGLSPSAMSLIERDERSVKSRELSMIADALGVSPLALLEDDSLVARLPVAARTFEPEVLAGTAYRRVTALAELNDVLTEAGIGASPQLDDVPEFDPSEWLDGARKLAAWARERVEPRRCEEGRFSVLADAIESKLGVDVLVERHPGDSLLGAAISDRIFPFIFINGDTRTTRALFTLAHELGHVLASHDGGFALDKNFDVGTDDERFANAFAAELLMPAAEVRSMIEDLGRNANSLAKMISRFEVSFEALIYRLHNLRVINARGRDELRSIGWGGLRQHTRDDDQLRLDQLCTSHPPSRSPGLLTGRALLGYRAGVVSVRPIASLLGRDADELLAALALTANDAFEVIDAAAYDTPDPSVDEKQLYDDVAI